MSGIRPLGAVFDPMERSDRASCHGGLWNRDQLMFPGRPATPGSGGRNAAPGHAGAWPRV